MKLSAKQHEGIDSAEEGRLSIVVIAASAGGVEAQTKLLPALPAILARRCALRIGQAEEGDELAPGTAYIAPPNQDLLVNGDETLALSRSELIHFVGPSADLLFESMAASFKGETIGVVLTGTGSAGTMGVQALAETRGRVIAQEPATADFAGMSRAAVTSRDRETGRRPGWKRMGTGSRIGSCPGT